MKKELTDIINEYEKFKVYLEGIDTGIFENFSRAELLEFEKKLSTVDSFRYWSKDLTKTIAKKKIEEFPQLLGVHRFPKINEIDFLKEEDKIKLDKYLATLGLNYYFGYFSNDWSDLLEELEAEDVEEKILAFLIEKEMAYKKHRVHMCCDSSYYTDEELTKMIRYKELDDKNNRTEDEWNEYSKLEKEIETEYYCDECGNESELPVDNFKTALKEPLSQCLYKMKVVRDRTYDNL